MSIKRRQFLGMAAAAPFLAPATKAFARAEQTVPVIFDTDIGSDIDDALTLAYLLAQPRCELVGVTTCHGDTMDRARLASAICMQAGREIEIHPGSSRLISGKLVEGRVPQAEVLPDWPHRDDFEPDSAAEFMYRSLKSRPGQIHILAVGPLTNMARLFERHPDSPALLKGLTLMNGSFRILYPEYNVIMDPQATRQVYRTELPSCRVIDFDTSLQCQIWKKEARRKIMGEAFGPVADMLEIFFRLLPVVTFYDSIAAASIFEPGLVRFRSTRVRYWGGRTFPSLGPGPHQVSIDVDQKRFKQHYFETVKRV